MTRLILVRHGESEANFKRICAGQSDYPLTELGRKQAEAAGEALKDIKIDAVFSSDLSRAYDTGRAIAIHHGLSVTKDIRLREIHRGIFEGQFMTELEKKYTEQYNVLIHNKPFADIEGGESTEQVQERVFECISEIAQNHPDQTVLIAFHATALRYFCAKIINLPKDQIIKTFPLCQNGALTYVNYSEGKFEIVKYNDQSHLNNIKSQEIQE